MATIAAPRTRTPAPEQRIVLHGVGWPGYETMLRLVGDRAVRLTYDRGDLELMSPSQDHERYKRLFGLMVQALAEELLLALESRPEGELLRGRRLPGGAGGLGGRRVLLGGLGHGGSPSAVVLCCVCRERHAHALFCGRRSRRERGGAGAGRRANRTKAGRIRSHPVDVRG